MRQILPSKGPRQFEDSGEGVLDHLFGGDRSR